MPEYIQGKPMKPADNSPGQPPRSRKPGRPRKNAETPGDLPLISRETVIECAYQLCDTLRIEDISLELLGRTLGVSATTIRHHAKTRDALNPALIARYFKELCAKLPPLTEDWKADLNNFMSAHMAMNLRKRGFASYFFEHRFSPEIDPFASPEAEMVYKRALMIFRAAGLDTVNAALAWHLIIHLLLSIAYAEARGQTPADQAIVFEGMAQATASQHSDRTVLAALRYVNLPMIYGVIANMVRHAIEVKFDFPDEPSVP